MNTIHETDITDYRLTTEEKCLVVVDPEHMNTLLAAYDHAQFCRYLLNVPADKALSVAIDELKQRAEAAEKRVQELGHTFNLQWDASRRATKRWQEAHPERGDVWPDSADLMVWLMGRVAELEAERAAHQAATEARKLELNVFRRSKERIAQLESAGNRLKIFAEAYRSHPLREGSDCLNSALNDWELALKGGAK